MKSRTSLFFLFLWILLIFFTLTLYFMRIDLSSMNYGGTDFFKFYQSVRFYFAGQSLYAPTIFKKISETSSSWVSADGNLNPPFFTLFLLPLYYVNYAAALKIWTMGSLVCLFVGGWLALRPFPQWHKYTLPVLIAFAIYIPNSANISYGQISSYLLIFIVSGWLAGRNKQDILAGIFIGIACAIKLFCGLFLIYFLCIKRFRLFFTTCMTGIIAFMSSLWLFGMDNYFRYRAVFKKIAWYTATWNASFYGFFMRLFSNTEKNKTLIAVPYLTNILTIICCILLIIYLIYTWRKLGNQYFDIGFSLTLIGMLLLSPLGWTYYFGLLLVPYLILISQSENTRYQTLISVSACVILFFSTLTGSYVSALYIKTLFEVLFNGGMGFYVLISFLILYMLLIKEKLAKNTIILSQRQDFEKIHWVILYIIAFWPSIISFLYIARNILT